jgi:YaaC-like Protein
MILRDASIVPSADHSRYAWTGLARFQNVAFVEEQICRIHSLGKAARQNARKQARQIRYTLIQAKEYFDAAEAVTLATKPNLLYYSIMSLALAEILFKQTGSSSLDSAREQHRHHGLTLHVANVPQDTNLESASSALVAKPLIRAGGERFGTFELWHRSCREMPLCGNVTINHSSGRASTTSFFPVLNPVDVRLPLVPHNGLTLFDCLRASPGMMSFLPQFGIIPDLVRGRLTATNTIDDAEPFHWRPLMTLILHPEHGKQN